MGVDATEVGDIPAGTIKKCLGKLHDALAGLWAEAAQSQRKRQTQNDAALAKRRKRGCRVPTVNLGDAVLIAEAVPASKLAM